MYLGIEYKQREMCNTMIVDTHLLISQILYKYLSKQINFKLDRLSFAYGNIKPDFINKDIKCSHTLDKSLYNVEKFSEQLMTHDISIKEFSKSLGVICHFACDYFCIYHREGNERKNIFEHLLYEVILHIKLIALLITGKLDLEKYEIDENSPEDLVMLLQKKYNLQSKSLTRDIMYALYCASQISKLIVCSSQLYVEETNILKQYHLHLSNDISSNYPSI